MPDHKEIRDHKQLKFFGTLLHDPNLWHLNRRSVSGAFSVGLFVAFVPIPFQMVLAAATAIMLRVNLPIAATLVWITNPITMPPMYYFAYKVGAILLDHPIQVIKFELTFNWLMTRLGDIWEPFLLGCLILGALSALCGNLFIRWAWRFHVIKNWQARRERRRRNRQKASRLED